MDVYTAIAARKSVHAFQDREVPDELLLQLLEAARLAPSACNFQEWRLVVVRNP
jgi:nitroreductase